MRRPLTWSLLVLLSACGASISEAPRDAGVDDAPNSTVGRDAAIDGVRLGPWSTPAKVPAASTLAVEDDVTLSSNALEMVFAVVADTTGKDLYYTSRASIDAPWQPAVTLPIDSPSTSEETPRFSPDDKTLYFASDRAGNGNLDIYAVDRLEPGSKLWGTVRPLTSVSTPTLVEKWFMPCAGNHYVMAQTAKTGSGTDLVEGILGSDPPAPITALNSDVSDTGPFLTRDCLTIYFATLRTTPEMIYTSHRAAIGSPWQPPTAVSDFAMLAGNQEDPWLSPDGRTFAFASDAAGNKDIYVSTR